MTIPLFIASGVALGVTLAAPGMAFADPAGPPPAQAAIEPLADGPLIVAAPDMLRHAVDTATTTLAKQPDEGDQDTDAAGALAKAQENADASPSATAKDVRDVDDNDNESNNDGGDADARAANLPAELADDHWEAPPIDGKPIALTLSPLPAVAYEEAVQAQAGAQAETMPATGAATEAATTDSGPDVPALNSPLAQELIAGFYSRINVLGYGILQDPINSNLNPNNALAIPRYQTQLNFRPDFNLNFRQFEFGIKPRFEADWSHVQNGVEGGTDITTATAYINEWIARYRVTNQVIASYGRENLQWGPSQLLSPSNPFNQNNGKNNPAIEQPGMDYARVVVIPNSSLTGSFIANTGEGRLNDSGEASGPFHKAYAGKFDYTGEKTYFSLIVSKRDTTPWRIGYFGEWNVSNA